MQNNLLLIKNVNIHVTYKLSILNTVKQINKYSGDLKLDAIALFGSCARGNIHGSSDIDLLLLTSADTEKDIRLMVLDKELEEETFPIPIQITVRKTDNFSKQNKCSNFNEVIKEDLIYMIDYREVN